MFDERADATGDDLSGENSPCIMLSWHRWQPVLSLLSIVRAVTARSGAIPTGGGGKRTPRVFFDPESEKALM